MNVAAVNEVSSSRSVERRRTAVFIRKEIMASIRDVAQKAGVGVGTVSRVINGSGYVAEDTRKKIESAIRELEYTPNELARNLFKNRTGIIGVLVPDLDHPFFFRFCKGDRDCSL